MNISRRITLAFLVAATAGALISPAQSPNPDNTSAQAANAQQAVAGEALPSPSATVPVEPPSLIPPNILPGAGAGSLPQMPQAPDLQQLNAIFKQSSLGKAADEARLHLQMAQLETRIRNDRELHVARAAADRMPTDLERRHQLRAYYRLYYSKLRALATTPELKTYLDLQENVHLWSLLQPKVRHETDEAEWQKIRQATGRGATALPTPYQARAYNSGQP
jgi:hypothetical protein